MSANRPSRRTSAAEQGKWSWLLNSRQKNVNGSPIATKSTPTKPKNNRNISSSPHDSVSAKNNVQTAGGSSSNKHGHVAGMKRKRASVHDDKIAVDETEKNVNNQHPSSSPKKSTKKTEPEDISIENTVVVTPFPKTLVTKEDLSFTSLITITVGGAQFVDDALRKKATAAANIKNDMVQLLFFKDVKSPSHVIKTKSSRVFNCNEIKEEKESDSSELLEPSSSLQSHTENNTKRSSKKVRRTSNVKHTAKIGNKKNNLDSSDLSMDSSLHMNESNGEDEDVKPICDKLLPSSPPKMKEVEGKPIILDRSRSRSPSVQLPYSFPLPNKTICMKCCADVKISNSNWRDLECHLSSHVTDKPFACSKCDRASESVVEMKVHIQIVHSDNASIIDNRTPSLLSRLCDLAPVCFPMFDGFLKAKIMRNGVR